VTPIYVVNLLSSSVRRKAMIEQLIKLNLRFQLFDAIAGKDINNEIKANLYSSQNSLRLHNRELTNNEIGCAMSHLGVYYRMIESNQECAIVLEDDVYIGEAFRMFVERMPLILEKDWEMINLISEQGSTPFGDPIFDIYRLSNFWGAANGCVAYAIKLSGAKKLCDYAMPIRFAADGLTGRFYETGLKLLGLVPHIVALRDVASDIGAR
jgi:glycosyl transferase family 25